MLTTRILLAGAIGLAACDSADPVGRTLDGAPTDDGTPDAHPCEAEGSARKSGCNPVTLQGCADGEKCTFVRLCDVPVVGRTDCVPDGDVALGGPCELGPTGRDTGYDDCAYGGICLDGTCRAICVIEPDTCAEGTCALHDDLFTDVTTGDVGACEP